MSDGPLSLINNILINLLYILYKNIKFLKSHFYIFSIKTVGYCDLTRLYASLCTHYINYHFTLHSPKIESICQHIKHAT